MSQKEESQKSVASLSASTIFTYSLEHMSKTDKVRFYYALKGRDGKSGVVVAWNVEQLGRAVLFVSAKHAQDVIGFLKFWKCPFESKEVWVK